MIPDKKGGESKIYSITEYRDKVSNILNILTSIFSEKLEQEHIMIRTKGDASKALTRRNFREVINSGGVSLKLFSIFFIKNPSFCHHQKRGDF